MILKILSLIFCYHVIEGQAEFLNVIAPKEVYVKKPLKLFYDGPVSSDIEYIFSFRDSLILKKVDENPSGEAIFDDAGASFGRSKTFPFSVLAVKNDQCISAAAEISKNFPRGYSFIQTDKPIYKPNDEIKIRQFVLDENLRPYKANRVVMELIDSEGNKFEAIQTGEKFDGLYTFKFPLAENAILGDWIINARADNRSNFNVSKYISVQKYILPLFDVTIETPPTAYFTDGKIPLKIYAKYSFGEFAKGKATIKIVNVENQAVLYSEEINNVKNIIAREIDLMSNLKLNAPKSNISLNVTVDFDDEYSQTSRTKTEQIKIFPEKIMNLEIHAAEKFEAGKSFHIDCLLKYPSGELVNGKDIVTLDMSYLDSSQHEKHLINNKVLKHGIASFNFQIPNGVSKATITAKYLHFSTQKDVSADLVNIQSGFFNIFLPDETRKLGGNLLVVAKSDQKMSTVAFVVVGKNGIETSLLQKCYGQKECSAGFKIIEGMLPISYIYAYNFNKKGKIAQDSMKIQFDDFSTNFLKTQVKQSKLEPGKNAKFEISSKPNSTIGILAFDKSLTFLRKGNDVEKKDVLSAIDHFDNPMHILKIDLVTFRTCTAEENELIEKARLFDIDERFGEDEFEFDDFEKNEIDDSDLEKPVRAGEVRKNFPETWIFETFEMNEKDLVEKEYKLPDTITTWLVSGFSINAQHGFVLSDPQELISTQEFFIKMTLPYSIKFGEILKVDLITYNYVKSGSDVKVKLKLFDDDFDIVKLKDPETCEIVSSNEESTGEIAFEVASNSGVSKSFYIRPTEQERNIIVKVKALATETQNRRKRYSDAIEKNLKVIHEGATHFKGEMKTFDFSSASTNTTSGKLEFENAVESSILIHGSITGNIIGPSLSIFEEFLVLPDGCAAQTLAQFHKNSHIYRYLLTAPTASKESLEKSQQNLLSGLQKMNSFVKADGTYGLYESNPTSIWITAFSAQVFGDAMNFFDNIIKNEKLITDALEYCKNNQEPNGKYTSSWLWSDIPITEFETEESFDVRNTAFVLISFLKNPNLATRFKGTIEKAFNYIDENKYIADAFGHALVAYCYALNHQKDKAQDVLDQLKQNTVSNNDGEFIYWTHQNEHKRFKVILTSYTALAYLKIKKMPKLFTDWLITQRDLRGDFYDDFDTAIATEAITEMARFSREINMNVQVENAIGEKVVDYMVTNGNALSPYYFEIPKHFSEYKITASGTGKVVVGAFYEFTKNDDILSDAFNLSVQPTKNDFQATIKACVNYKVQNRLNETVIMEFALASGFVYDSNLNNFEGNNLIKNVELKKQNTIVQLHLQGITKQSSCVEIKTHRSHVIARTKKPFVKVYEYMDKEKFSAQFYSLEPLSCF